MRTAAREVVEGQAAGAEERVGFKCKSPRNAGVWCCATLPISRLDPETLVTKASSILGHGRE